MINKELQEMIKMAQAAMNNAYAPYSNYRVGACMRSGNNFFSGCNVENFSYSVTICAESSALSSLITAGLKKIDEVVLLCSTDTLCSPCGACRQRILELSSSPDIPIHLCDRHGKPHKTLSIASLLPRP